MRSKLLNNKEDFEKKAVAVTGWVIIVGVLAAWLAIGTVCMIYVFHQFILK